MLVEIAKIFPEAPIFTLLKKESFVLKMFLGKRKIMSSFLDKIAFIVPHKYLLPLYPIVAESIDLREYDMVVSSTSSFMKGLVVKPKTVHICYCHTPTRYLWDSSEEYFFDTFGKKNFFSPRKIVIRVILNYLRMWDQSSARRVDLFIANSHYTAQRIRKYYKRKAKVVYPPVDIEKFIKEQERTGKYFLVVSRLSPYKNINLVVEAFNRLKWPLVIAGEGKEKKRLMKMANRNIRFLGFVPERKLAKLYSGARALIFPGEDDFGITMVEAMASGKPVLALRKGGAEEIVEEGKTGEFFNAPEVETLVDGLRRLVENEKNYQATYLKESAKRFSKERFKEEFLKVVGEKVNF